MEHGFPHKPTALAYDPKMKIIAIGTKSGALRMYPFLNVQNTWKSVHHPLIFCSQIYFFPSFKIDVFLVAAILGLVCRSFYHIVPRVKFSMWKVSMTFLSCGIFRKFSFADCTVCRTNRCWCPGVLAASGIICSQIRGYSLSLIVQIVRVITANSFSS